MRILSLFFTTILIFQAPGLAVAAEGQAECIGCMALPKNEVQAAIQATRNVITSQMSGQATYEVLASFGAERACRNFANASGYGNWGKYMEKTFTAEKYPALFAGTDDIIKICPAFDSQDFNKTAFYIHLFTFLSKAESTCDSTARAQGPNGAAVGLLALHEYREGYYTAQSSNKCVKGDSRKPLESLRCGMAMLESQVAKRGALFSRNSYWGPLTPQTRKKTTVLVMNSKGQRVNKRMNVHTFVKTAIENYPFCK